jgi:hypothetical protein
LLHWQLAWLLLLLLRRLLHEQCPFIRGAVGR